MVSIMSLCMKRYQAPATLGGLRSANSSRRYERSVSDVAMFASCRWACSPPRCPLRRWRSPASS